MTRRKLISGFCAHDFHEGTKPKTYDGSPMAICKCWETCDCSCHTKITEMYETLGLPREPAMQNPEYLEVVRAERAKFIMPDPVAARIPDYFNPGDTIPHADDEGSHTVPENPYADTLGPVAPVTLAPRFAPTPTGRRARGQLEFDVLQVCLEFANDVYDWEYCTPKLVAEQIGKQHAIEPPSTGAVDAVWNRWEALGFAKRDHKPSRFVEFTVDDASAITLERMKIEKKRAKKRTVAEQRRGIPRPPVRSKR